jgi:D-alanyl-D-alanine carboxypeptidase/D-alanyl-D-alanine-endopeptidase (penicillin-binding protein 4)
VPSVLSDDVRFRDFQARLDAYASRLPEQSCFTVDVEGRRMVTKNGSLSLLPASNMKLLVAAAALATLGPDYRFTTRLYGKIENGIVDGDLTVVGGGDPTFQSDGFESTLRFPNVFATTTNTFVEALRDIGVSRITGSIVVDEGRYDTERWAPTLGLGVRATEVGPLGAMMINDGAVLGDPLKPDNPAFAAARELTRVLLSAGIAVDGAPQVRTVEQQTDSIAEVDSPPLSDVLVDLLSNSDNNHAELILKELGVAVSEQGTREAGLTVVNQYLQGKGIDVSSLTMIDGAGLDRANRFSCDLVQAVLLQHDSQLFDALSLAGRSGTLRELFIGNAMEGRLRGKTGTLTGAKALSGYVPYSDDENITFALILNGPSVANQSFYRPLWNQMGDVFATLKDSPSVAEIAPFAS